MRIPHATVVPVLLASALVAQKSFPESMDFGPCLMTTFDGGGLCGTTEKGLVIRLGDRGAVSFDTELLRMSVAWTDGWLRLRGTAYDGSHGPFPALRGKALAETAVGPGWAREGSFEDPRPIPHGPLPKAWGQYGGYNLVGDDVVIDYRLGDMNVRELYGIAGGSLATVLRTLELGPSKVQQKMVVWDGPNGAKTVELVKKSRSAALLVTREKKAVQLDGSAIGWDALAFGAPSSVDYLDAKSGSGATIAAVEGFARVHGGADRSVPKLVDGMAATNQDDPGNSVWFDKHQVNGRKSDRGRYLIDLKKAVDVTRVNTFSWHRAERARQNYELWGRNGAGDAGADNLQKAGWQRIATVDTNALGRGDMHAASIAKEGGLGTFTHLLLDVKRGATFFSEIDVYAGGVVASKVGPGDESFYTAVLSGSEGPSLSTEGSRIVMTVPPHDATLRVQLALTRAENAGQAGKLMMMKREVAPIPTGPSKKRWETKVITKGVRGSDDGPFAVDTITIPFDNPYGSRMRTGAFDFFADGRAAVSTWNGDVWIVSGIDDTLANLQWQRFATGLFDPLGLRIVDDTIYVHGRDGLTRLIDSNGDGEADRYECFNNQIYITAAFHEFAFDLQTDKDGNFYFTKGAPVNPGGRGFMKIVPHHGAILKVSKDGSTIETVATGMRAPNGMGVSPEGILTSGDNEGTYMPRCRLNWIEKPGFYAGVKDTAHKTPVPDQPDLPLCWMPMEVDNSSGGQVWVTGDKWKDLQGRLLHNSYGTCSTYLVLPERVNGQMQGGVVRLPANYSSSCMRGRFSPIDGELYVIGLKGWQTSAAREGGFHRVRRTGRPLDLPVALSTCDKGVYLTFSNEVDAELAADPESFGVEIWNYRYSQSYGSPEISVLEPDRQIARGKPNRDPLKVTSSKLSSDGRTVFLAIEGMRPVHQMKITWDLDTKDGRPLRGELHNSIHNLQKDPGFPKGK